MSPSPPACKADSPEEEVLRSSSLSVNECGGDEDVSGQHSEHSADLLQRALDILTKCVQPYLPLHRRPDQNTFEGHDLVDQHSEGKPFNAVGIVIEASRLIKSWENHIEGRIASRIEVLQSKEKPITTTARLVKSKQHHGKTSTKDLSQPIAYALTLPKKDAKIQKFAVVSGGMVFIKEAYLRRIELENVIYRRHLDELETELQMKVAKQLRREVEKSIKDCKAAKAQHKTKQFNPPKKLAAKGKNLKDEPQGIKAGKRKATAEDTDQSPRTQKAKRRDSTSHRNEAEPKGEVVDLTNLAGTGDSAQICSSGKGSIEKAHKELV